MEALYAISQDMGGVVVGVGEVEIGHGENNGVGCDAFDFVDDGVERGEVFDDFAGEKGVYLIVFERNGGAGVFDDLVVVMIGTFL